jgi:hypothetical protein
VRSSSPSAGTPRSATWLSRRSTTPAAFEPRCLHPRRSGPRSLALPTTRRRRCWRPSLASAGPRFHPPAALAPPRRTRPSYLVSEDSPQFLIWFWSPSRSRSRFRSPRIRICTCVGHIPAAPRCRIPWPRFRIVSHLFVVYLDSAQSIRSDINSRVKLSDSAQASFATKHLQYEPTERHLKPH